MSISMCYGLIRICICLTVSNAVFLFTQEEFWSVYQTAINTKVKVFEGGSWIHGGLDTPVTRKCYKL